MKRLATVVTMLTIVLNAGPGAAASSVPTKGTTLGVPSYPGWAVHRLDDKADDEGKTHVYQYQYYSDDPAQKIVQFYEDRIGGEASFAEPTHTYTINASGGAVIQITAPPEGVPQIDGSGEPTGKTWKALITIIRFQAQEGRTAVRPSLSSVFLRLLI